ncbi:MAG: hypothetical protein ACYTG0_14365 [Planctomycetota bacterium]|jgi:hypothetical protein
MKALNEQTALAIVFANTKRKKRTEDLITVAEAFDHLVKLYGSQRATAKKVGFRSPEMVREFLKILSLPAEVKQLVRARKIDRLDVAYRISMLAGREEQIKAARESAGLSTDDMRDVKRLISTAGMSAEESKKKVLESRLRGLHVFVMDFDDEEYKQVISEARRKRMDPAELVKQVVIKWLQGIRRRGKRKD